MGQQMAAGHGARAGVVVSPRERMTILPQTLATLFATIPADVPVSVVTGDLPPGITAALRQLLAARPFRLMACAGLILPNAARNLAAAGMETDFILFLDDDVALSPGALEALAGALETTGADAAAPLCLLGPKSPPVIHHAGGSLGLVPQAGGGAPAIHEVHHLMNAPLSQEADRMAAAGVQPNEVCEFHCMLMRKALWDRMGGFDERLVTREHVDLALRMACLDARAVFVPQAVVTYLALEPLLSGDLDYFLFRWSDRFVAASMDAIEDTWGLPADRAAVHDGFIRGHRARAIATALPALRRGVDEATFRSRIVPAVEADHARRTQALADALPRPLVPPRPDRDRAAAVLAALAARSGPAAAEPTHV
ncbi:MAG TPA: glycosyltransferase [Paracoccaceae bacterium]|nr:glycosyltransferase [Paracoccaceae bacterium]HMO71340.1 glycosyltransferase [Paracoccaceae bacterium]